MYYSPFKKLLSVVYIGAVIAVVIGFLFFFNWMLNHIYTIIWFLLVLGCLFWLVLSVFDTFKSRWFGDDDDLPLPSEKFEG